MLTAMGVGRVLLDTRPIYDGIDTPEGDPQIGSERKKPKVPLQPVVTADFTIVRYISHPNHDYNQPYFDQWVPRFHQWLAQGKDIYFFAIAPRRFTPQPWSDLSTINCGEPVPRCQSYGGIWRKNEGPKKRLLRPNQTV
jgi:hypothetical protein